jgi:hypothetical protein
MSPTVRATAVYNTRGMPRANSPSLIDRITKELLQTLFRFVNHPNTFKFMNVTPAHHFRIQRDQVKIHSKLSLSFASSYSTPEL